MAKCRCLQEWQVYFRILAAKYQQYWHPLTTVNFKEECKVVVLKTMHDFTLTQQHIFLTLKFHLTHSYQSEISLVPSTESIHPKMTILQLFMCLEHTFVFIHAREFLKNYWKRTNTRKVKTSQEVIMVKSQEMLWWTYMTQI